MLKNFRAYQLAVRFYKTCEKVHGPKHLQDQLLRASSSVALNLAEGSEGVSDQNRRRFYRISMASMRESQAIIDLLSSNEEATRAKKIADELGACIFGLCRALDKKLARRAES